MHGSSWQLCVCSGVASIKTAATPMCSPSKCESWRRERKGSGAEDFSRPTVLEAQSSCAGGYAPNWVKRASVGSVSGRVGLLSMPSVPRTRRSIPLLFFLPPTNNYTASSATLPKPPPLHRAVSLRVRTGSLFFAHCCPVLAPSTSFPNRVLTCWSIQLVWDAPWMLRRAVSTHHQARRSTSHEAANTQAIARERVPAHFRAVHEHINGRAGR